MKIEVEIYSDIACPWCYIGERRLARALAAFPRADQVNVVFHPYQLDPGAPEVPVPLPEYLVRRFGGQVDAMLARVTDVARGEGISIAWDKALAANTRSAHRVLMLAEEEYGGAVQRALAGRLFDLHFTRGGNIADHDQLATAAASVGMDKERVRAYLLSDDGVQKLEAAFANARSLGVHSVPTFVIGGTHVVQGAQSAAKLLEALEEAARMAHPTKTADGDSCADGACAVHP